jgi:hypothetical protein
MEFAVRITPEVDLHLAIDFDARDLTQIEEHAIRLGERFKDMVAVIDARETR